MCTLIVHFCAPSLGYDCSVATQPPAGGCQLWLSSNNKGVLFSVCVCVYLCVCEWRSEREQQRVLLLTKQTVVIRGQSKGKKSCSRISNVKLMQCIDSASVWPCGSKEKAFYSSLLQILCPLIPDWMLLPFMQVIQISLGLNPPCGLVQNVRNAWMSLCSQAQHGAA